MAAGETPGKKRAHARDFAVPDDTHAHVEALASLHVEILQACDRLELICDSLPRAFSRVDCLEMALWLDETFPVLVRREEETLARVIGTVDLNHDAAAAKMSQRDHRADMAYAIELAEALTHFARKEQAAAVDTIGYMARAFFELVRRHVAYEDELIARATGRRKKDR